MKFEDELFYNCKIDLNTGESYLVTAYNLHGRKLDNWKGWHCNAGNTRLYIHSDGTVFNGECFTETLGNLNTNWNLLATPTVCPRNTCTGCTDDLLTTKYKGPSQDDN